MGIDVGGPKKGFHAAVLPLQEPTIRDLLHFQSPGLLAGHLKLLVQSKQIKIKAIAIDCPAQAEIASAHPRQAELELHQAGYRVQWTPRQQTKTPAKKQSWMVHGTALWQALAEALPRVPLMECFPTAASNAAFHQDIQLPLRLLAGQHNRKYYKDFIDACLAAQVARDFARKSVMQFGREDALQPIYNSARPAKVCTLVMVTRRHQSRTQILLGMKKRGFGQGYWNGFGGKVQLRSKADSTTANGDRSIKHAAARELEEEAGLTRPELQEQGRLYFSFGNKAEIIVGHVFHCPSYTGEPRESDEMRPRWFDIKSIPYAKMWQDDRYWLPYMLAGHSFSAYFHFDDQDRLLAQSIQLDQRFQYAKTILADGPQL